MPLRFFFVLAKFASYIMKKNEKGIKQMNSIYFEVPKNTNEAVITVPCGAHDEFLWNFTIMFVESKHLKMRTIVVADDHCESGNSYFRQKEVSNADNRTARFEYNIDEDDIKTNVSLQVFFSKNKRIIRVEWK